MYDSTNKRGNLYDFGTSSTTKNPPELRIYSETGYREPDVVTKAYNSETGQYDKDDYDANTTYLNIITDLKTKTAGEFKKLLQSEFDNMIESVKKYGGFYIGRYETQGMTSTISGDKKIEDIIPTVKKEIEPSTNINWYYMYQESKNIGKNNKNVTSSMIWGCQWDRTLDWIAQTNQKDGKPDYSLLTDSRSWGNHSDNTESNHGTLQSSGSNDKWQKNHIYDLAGNVWEWTLEAYSTDYRIYRGGCFNRLGSDLPASFRNDSNGPSKSNSNYEDLGSRSTLYINL